jgi:hypothetical protein
MPEAKAVADFVQSLLEQALLQQGGIGPGP